MDRNVRIAVAAANQLGEGVVWSPAQHRVLWTDIAARQLWSYDPASGASGALALPERLACFAPLAGSGLLAGFASGLARYDTADGARTAVAAIEPERPSTRLNDGRLDRQGRLVFGTMDEAPDGAQEIGQVWSYDGRTPPRVLFGGVRIANSIAFSRDGRRLYFADTPSKTIELFDYDPASGQASNRRVFARIGPEGGYPDGSTVDAEDCLWNAEWGGGRVVRYAPDGRVDRVIALPCRQVTCCAFGGDDLATLYVTSARIGLRPEALATQPLAGALFAVRGAGHGIADTPFAG